MATTIKLKNGSGAPLAGDLVQGEPALDLTNKRLYTENASGTIIEVGTSPSTIDINAGTIDGTVIGSSTAAAGTFTTFTSTGIDDNATSTAITIDSSQNVGIGTASPGYLLTVGSTGNATAAIIAGITSQSILNLGDTSNGVVGQILYDHTDNSMRLNTAATERMRIDSSGDLLLGGTTSYTSFLSSSTGNLQVNGGIIGEPGSGNPFQIANYRSSPIAFLTSGNIERMRIDSSGNVGIGETSPDTRLHVTGTTSDYGILAEQPSGYAGLALKSTTVNQTWSFIAQDNGSNSDLHLYGGSSAGIKMTVDSSGNVGIGAASSSPTALLSVGRSTSGTLASFKSTGASGEEAIIYADSAGAIFGRGDGSAGLGNDYLYMFDNMQFVVNGSERMRIDSSGNLLVGTTSTSAVIGGTVDGQYLGSSGTRYSSDNGTGGKNHNIFYNANGQVGSISTSGSSTTFSTSSDQRLKENIVDAPAGNIDAIRVRSFDWKADGSHQTYGMVAQELVDVAPEAVTQGETEDEMWGVDYSKLVPMMIKEIQDLKAEVAALKGA